MRKVILPLAFVVSSTAVACSFEMHAGTKPNTPTAPAQPAATPATPAATAATHGTGAPVAHLGKRAPGHPAGPTPTPAASTTSTATVPSSAPVVAIGTVFGSNAVDATGFKGTLYFIDAGATKIPDLTTLKPAGFLFTKQLNVAPQAFTGGFPGIDATRKENFAIRYEAPLVVTTEADYDFRVLADDGAKVLIDGTSIVDDDGVKTAAADKEGPVHLVVGTHLLTVDYFQTSGNVALQLFCKKVGDVEKLCPTQL